MATKCDHSLCQEPATIRASTSDTGREWVTGHFCALHGLAFTADEPFVDIAHLAAVPVTVFQRNA